MEKEDFFLLSTSLLEKKLEASFLLPSHLASLGFLKVARGVFVVSTCAISGDRLCVCVSVCVWFDKSEKVGEWKSQITMVCVATIAHMPVQ